MMFLDLRITIKDYFLTSSKTLHFFDFKSNNQNLELKTEFSNSCATKIPHISILHLHLEHE